MKLEFSYHIWKLVRIMFVFWAWVWSSHFSDANKRLQHTDHEAQSTYHKKVTKLCGLSIKYADADPEQRETRRDNIPRLGSLYDTLEPWNKTTCSLGLFSHDGNVRILNFNSKCAFWIKIRKMVFWTVCMPNHIAMHNLKCAFQKMVQRCFPVTHLANHATKSLYECPDL